MLPGHQVECCYGGTFAKIPYSDAELVSGCDVVPMCVHPDELDASGDGQFSPSELQDVCNQKCIPGWPGAEAVRPSWDPATPGDKVLWNCDARTGPASSVISENSCTPPPGGYQPYGENVDVPPTHASTFTTGSSHSRRVNMTVLGVTVEPDAALDVEFVLDRCDTAGFDGGTCRLVLQRFDFTTTSTFEAGDYDVLAVELELAGPVVAKVEFDACKESPCTGSFSFEQANGNELAMTLRWSQQNRERGNIDEGALPIGNDSESLGGIHAVQGIIEIDPRTGGGQMLLNGSGSDRLGGDFAAVGFNLRGPVARI